MQPPAHLLWMGSAVRYYAPVHQLFRNKGVRIALLVAVCGAVAVNFDKFAMLRSSATFAPAFILLFCGISGLLKTGAAKEWDKVGKEHLSHLLVNPIVYTVVMVCYWSAFAFGFAAYVGALKRINIVFALLLGWLVLGEVKVKKRWPGAIIMMVGAALLAL
ncbi:MAG: EamA family transporter [Parcubacteria group bacterium]|nr:EamA family transporter [Parcubacteria group bacterium]